MIFDFIRAPEPAYLRKDAKEYLHRVRGKLAKLRRKAEYFEGDWKRVSTHTNFEMAALSLLGVVRQMEDIFAAVDATPRT